MKWCDEISGHSGLHTHKLGDLAGMEAINGGRATLQAVLTGATARDRHLELIAANKCAVRMLLTWPQVARLGTIMLDSVRRYG